MKNKKEKKLLRVGVGINFKKENQKKARAHGGYSQHLTTKTRTKTLIFILPLTSRGIVKE